jgi:hypothetical protein
MDDPGPANLEAMMAIDLSSQKWKVQAGPVDPQAKIASISGPDDDWEVLEWPPWVHFAEEHKAQAAADVFMAGPWRYFCRTLSNWTGSRQVPCRPRKGP